MTTVAAGVDGGAVYERLRLEAVGRIGERNVSAASVEYRTVVETEIDKVLDRHQRDVAGGIGEQTSLNRGKVRARLSRSVLDYGPLTPFLADVPIAEEILILGGEISFIAGSRLVVHPETCHRDEMLHHVRRLLADAGYTVDAANPQVRCMVLAGTARITVTIPPVSPLGLDVALRRYTLRSSTLRELVEKDSLTDPAAQTLALAARSLGRTVLVGPPRAGKTSLANAMLRCVPPTVVTRVLQDVPELQTTHLTGGPWAEHRGGPDGKGSRTLRQLGEAALQAAPGFFVLGETKGAEAFLIVRLANAGCGFLTTTHANSAVMAMDSLVDTALLAGENVSESSVRRRFAAIIHLVVFCDLEPLHLVPAGREQRRQVMEIAVMGPFAGTDTGFRLDPLFIRTDFGEPLTYTGWQELPFELERLFRRTLPTGVAPRDVFEGRYREDL